MKAWGRNELDELEELKEGPCSWNSLREGSLKWGWQVKQRPAELGPCKACLRVWFVFFNVIYLFIYFCIFVCVGSLFLCEGFPYLRQAVHSSSRCAGLSLSWPLLLRSIGSRRAGSAVVAHGPSCSAACGIFPDRGLNPCPLHWQADSQPLRHQGSP